MNLTLAVQWNASRTKCGPDAETGAHGAENPGRRATSLFSTKYYGVFILFSTKTTIVDLYSWNLPLKMQFTGAWIHYFIWVPENPFLECIMKLWSITSNTTFGVQYRRRNFRYDWFVGCRGPRMDRVILMINVYCRQATEVSQTQVPEAPEITPCWGYGSSISENTSYMISYGVFSSFYNSRKTTIDRSLSSIFDTTKDAAVSWIIRIQLSP